MSMQQYEDRRENLWLDAYKNDPAFSYDDTPLAKVTSFFCKRGQGVVVDISGGDPPEKVIDYDIQVNVAWVSFHLNRTIKFKKKWNDYNITLLGNLQMYMDHCKSGGYERCILSAQEYMQIKPKK